MLSQPLFLLCIGVFIESLFSDGYDASHCFPGYYLDVCSKAGRSVQVIRQVGPSVCRDISLSLEAQEVHVLKSAYYLVWREVPASPVDSFCKILVEYQRQEACEKVCFDAVIPVQEDGPCLEVGLGDAEAVLDYPASSIYFYD